MLQRYVCLPKTHTLAPKSCLPLLLQPVLLFNWYTTFFYPIAYGCTRGLRHTALLSPFPESRICSSWKTQVFQQTEAELADTVYACILLGARLGQKRNTSKVVQHRQGLTVPCPFHWTNFGRAIRGGKLILKCTKNESQPLNWTRTYLCVAEHRKKIKKKIKKRTRELVNVVVVEKRTRQRKAKSVE